MRWYFVLRTERLPRQARDQHRINSQTGCVFLQGVKRKYIRAYQFAYSRIDEVEGDPTSHTARGVIASNLRGEVPERAVVIPGTYQKEFSSGNFGVPAALIIGRRKESTDKKTSLNEALREHNVAV